MIGQRAQPDPQLRPLGLQPLLHPVEDLGRATGGGEDDEPLRLEPHHRAVVDHHAVHPAHHAVADHAGLQRADQVGVEQVQEHPGVGTLHVDRAEGRTVQDPHPGTDSGGLPPDRVVHRLAVEGVVAGPQPLPHRLELGAVSDVPVVHRGDPDGLVEIAAIAARQRGERHRRVRRSMGGRAQLAQRQPGELGDDPGRQHTRGLSLIMSGADRGVALDVLHRAHPGSDRAGDVGDGRIALQVDEVGGQRRRVHPVGADAPAASPPGRPTAGVTAGPTDSGAGEAPSRRTTCSARDSGLAEHRALVEDTGRRADHRHPVHRPGRHEGAEPVVVAELPTALAEQVHGRVPASADQQGVAVEASAVGQHHAGDPGVAEHAGHPDALPDVDHGDGLGPGGFQIGQQQGRGVVGGQQHDPAPDEHAVPVQELVRRPRQQHARTVVVGEGDGPLVRPGRHHDLAGPDPPDPRPGGVLGRRAEMIGTPLQGQQQVVVVEGEGRGPLQVRHVRRRGQLGLRLVDPVRDRHQRSAGRRSLVHQGHPQTRPAPRPGRRPARPVRRRPRPRRRAGARCRSGPIRLRTQPSLSGQTPGHQPVDQLDRGGQPHRLRVRRLDVHQRAGILGPGRDDPARATETDAAARGSSPRWPAAHWPGCPRRIRWYGTPSNVKPIGRSRSSR